MDLLDRQKGRGREREREREDEGRSLRVERCLNQRSRFKTFYSN